jgi:hypothetical protein
MRGPRSRCHSWDRKLLCLQGSCPCVGTSRPRGVLPDVDHDGCSRTSVGCWYHCRRRFWEAAVCKSPVGREGLARIGRIFELDESWKDKPPSEIKRLRLLHLRVHVDSFFAWVDEQRTFFSDKRGYTRTALEYANNQRDVLTRFFDDGRLVLTNNGAERALKTIAPGRRAWLFCGSDDHAKSTAALYSVVASARLHGLDPEEYLRCLIRLVPVWPADRIIELAPCSGRVLARGLTLTSWLLTSATSLCRANPSTRALERGGRATGCGLSVPSSR